jgi:hypothetical protein
MKHETMKHEAMELEAMKHEQILFHKKPRLIGISDKIFYFIINIFFVSLKSPLTKG